MHVAMLSYGTRGDVQPMVGIALSLMARGHDVVLAAPTNHVTFVQRAGVKALPIAGDSEEILQSEQGRRWVAAGDVRSLMTAIVDTFKSLRDDVDRDVEAATEGADVIVTGILAAGMARVQRDVRRLPMVMTHTFPGPPTREFYNAVVDLPLGLPGPLNVAATTAILKLTWVLLGDLDRTVRRRRGLPLMHEDPIAHQYKTKGPGLHLWSPSLLPKPKDWGDNDVVTGFSRLPTAARAGLGESDGELDAFINDGDAPIFIGLGSMPIFDPRPVVETFCAAAERVGCRLIIGGTFDDNDAVAAMLPSFARLCGPADHDTLFPRGRAVVHHGGAGSTATSLRAGRATLVCPVLGDQYFWGRLVKRRGVGDTLPFQKLTAPRLQRGLEHLLSPPVQAAADSMGQAMRAETDGASVAADVIESVV